MVVPELPRDVHRHGGSYGSISPEPDAGISSRPEQEPEKTGSSTGTSPTPRYEPVPQSEQHPHRAVVGAGTDCELEVRGFRFSVSRAALFWLLTAALGLLPLLVTHWRPTWRLLLTHLPCPLSIATAVLVIDTHGKSRVESIELQPAGEDTPVQYQLCSAAPPTSLSSRDTSPLLQQELQCWVRSFWCYHLKYTWNVETGAFVQLSGLDRGMRVTQLLEGYGGYTPAQQQARLSLYGDNRIIVEVKSYLKLLVEEALNPFYIFQVCSLTLWALDDYVIYASCIFVISVISISISLYETRKQSETLRDMVVASAVSTVTVLHPGGERAEVCSERLVPGDVLVLPEGGCPMACDAVLITGSCIVNEAMLTGESVPVTKTSLAPGEDSELYSPENHKRHTLFCGTQVIQTRYYDNNLVLAVVIRTGFNTAKGELIRSILFPRPMGFRFYQDSMKFIGFLFLLSTFGLAYTVYLYIQRGSSVGVTLLRALDIFTIAVPPALPAAMTVGTVYAQNRLKAARIFCISPPRINVAGKLKLFCFDKTGTLTEDGLSMWGVVPCSSGKFSPPQQQVDMLSDSSDLKVALASCHGLTRLAGQLIGDPLDIKMFEATDWELEEPVASDTTKFDLLAPTVVRPRSHQAAAVAASLEELTPEVGIVRQFPFSSTSQRMSVICRTLGRRNMDLYCKGAPEKIESLCRPGSVPENFASVLHEYTLKGYRVLAVAYKPLDHKLHWHQVQRLRRDQVECDLEMAGLLVMQNKLKPETTPVIEQLHRAHIRSVMVTGDNLLTAVSVARECGMIPAAANTVVVTAHPPSTGHPAYVEYEAAAPGGSTGHNSQQVCVPVERADGSAYRLAVTGRSWRVLQQHFPSLVPRMVVQGAVFARMAPDQKAQLVETLQEQGYTVGMCGDGANDCEALKAAHVGISLSEAEASVAAPFTSKMPDIRCVPIVIREGRCALTTSFGTFKYMALYSMIQFISVLLLYKHESNLGDAQFLYIDLIITTTVAVLMGYTAAAPGLHARRPPGSLLGTPNVLSILTQAALVGVAQLVAMCLLEAQPWFVPVAPQNDVATVCWENSAVFFVSAYQYLTLATAFSRGPPFRRPFYTNRLFLAALLSLTGIQTWLVIGPAVWLRDLFGLMPATERDHQLRLWLLATAGAHCLTALALETLVFESAGLKRLLRRCQCKRQPKNRYKSVLRDLQADPEWPPVGRKVLQAS